MEQSERTERRAFYEEVGDLMEDHGFPHMAGRVVGALLIAVPPHLTMDELADALNASKGAISMATQLLARLQLIERISLPGERRRYYRMGTDVWERLFEQRAEHFESHDRLVRRGLALLMKQPAETKQRLMEMAAFTDFVHEQLPVLANLWRTQRSKWIEKQWTKSSGYGEES